MQTLFDDVAKVHGVTGVQSPYADGADTQVSKNEKIAYATISFAERDRNITQSSVDAITKLVDDARSGGIRIELSGKMFQSRGSFGATELIGLLAAIVILLLTFGSVLAMGLPIMIALFGIGTGLSLVAVFSHVLSTPELHDASSRR